jgi:hypothetical protein
VNELGAIETITFAWGEMRDMIQWWASISIGVIAVTHFWEKRINLPLVASLIVVYTLFTVYTITNVLGLGQMMNGYYMLLAELKDAGSLSVGGARMLDTSPRTSVIATATWALCSFGIYVGALTFLVLTYRRGRARN